MYVICLRPQNMHMTLSSLSIQRSICMGRPQNIHMPLMSLSTPEATVYGSSEYVYATHESLHPEVNMYGSAGPPRLKMDLCFCFGRGGGQTVLSYFR